MTQHKLFAAWGILAVLTAVPARASALSDTAANLKPGQWRAFYTSGLTMSMLVGPQNQPTQAWSDDAHWDPVTGTFLFLGQDHAGSYDTSPGTAAKFMQYSESANAWSLGPNIPTSAGDIGHAYDHSAFDPVGRKYYHNPYSDRMIYTYDADTRQWTQNLPDIPGSFPLTCCKGLAYFPDMDALVAVFQGSAGVLNLKTRQWSTLSQNLSVGTYCMNAEYSPVYKTVIFGGRTSDLYQVDATGKLTQMKAAPVTLDGCGASVVTTDPVTGKFLVWTTDGEFYEYDPSADSWRDVGGVGFRIPYTNPSLANGGSYYGVVAAPIEKYGIVMFLVFNYSSSMVVLYRHSASTTAAEGGAAKTTEGIHVSSNPFRSSVRVWGESGGLGRVAIHDLRGRRLAVRLPPGASRPVEWAPGPDVASGLYIVRGTLKGRAFSKTVLFER